MDLISSHSPGPRASDFLVAMADVPAAAVSLAEIVSLPVVARGLGYADAAYFRRQVAPGLGLAFRKARGRWYTTRAEFEAAARRRREEVAP